jgi:acetyl-CoA carboxylase carboxyl transferase subunit alpha
MQQIEKVKQVEDKNKLDMSATLQNWKPNLKLPKKKYTATLTAGKKCRSPVTPKGHIPCSTLS